MKDRAGTWGLETRRSGKEGIKDLSVPVLD